jgi:hypothetical protein
VLCFGRRTWKETMCTIMRRWNDNIRINFKEKAWEGVCFFFHVAQHRGKIVGCCAHGDEVWLSIKFGIRDYTTLRTCHGSACSFPGLLSRRLGFDPGSGHVGFVVDKVALRLFSL